MPSERWVSDFESGSGSGKEEGDEVEVNTPGGTKHYEIIKIEYN